MRLLFVRHGESEANRLRVLSNRGWKHPLTVRGRAQSRRLAASLREKMVIAIHSSPLRRAVETSQILAAELGIPMAVADALCEYDVGDYEDRGDDDAWELLVSIEQRWDEGDLDARMPGGESCRDIRSRFAPFVAGLLEPPGSDDATLVLVGHGGTFRRALPGVLANVEPRYAADRHLPNTGVVEAVLRDGVLCCVRWGDEAFE